MLRNVEDQGKKKDPYKIMNSPENTEISTLACVGLLKHIAL
jgi:hypothetical protein